jgi:hypothetical protein
MMFILRSRGDAPPALRIKTTRKTPDIVSDAAGKTDYFCVGDEADIAWLREAGGEVVALRDGWYALDDGGGIAIFGHGRYWEIRDTPFTVRESCGPAAVAGAGAAGDEPVNVRGAVFGV